MKHFEIFKRSNKLQRLVITIMFVITMIVIALIASLSGAMFSRSLNRSSDQYGKQLLDQVNLNIHYFLNEMDKIANAANYQSDVLKFLLNDQPVENNYAEYYQSIYDVRSFLQGLTTARGDIACISIVGSRKNVSSSSQQIMSLEGYAFTDEDWYSLELMKSNVSFYTPPHYASYLPSIKTPVISLVRSISLYPDSKPLGLIVIDLNISALESICSDIVLGDTGYIYIVDSQGNYLYHPQQDYLKHKLDDDSVRYVDDAYKDRVLTGENNFIMENDNGQRNIISCMTMKTPEWIMAGVMPYDEIYGEVSKLRTAIFVIGIFLAFILVFILAYSLRSLIFQRLNRLRKLMHKAQDGDLTVSYTDNRFDEISKLGASFNEMIKRISALMSDVVDAEEDKRKAELAVLQSQINPHFLYNSLDTIVWMAEYNKPGAAEMADMLGKFFRLSLSKGDAIVPLSQEMEHVDTYLRIQKIRYSKRFNYKLSVEEDIADKKVPKLIIQPFVENAIYHGIKPARKTCILIVRAFSDGGDAVVQILDDGVGMDEDQIEKIVNKRHSSSKPMGGVGINNVLERIKLYFSENSSINYYAIPKVGTTVEIRLVGELPEDV